MPARMDRDFVGRTAELAWLADVADKVRTSQHRTVVVQGPPGIGKSSLIRRFTHGLADFAVLMANGDPSEYELDFGIVDQLLARAPAELRARTPTLGSGALSGASPIAVGSQLLDLFGELQRRSPVAVVVDDIQWADPSSVQALRFLLRRTWSSQLLVVLSTRVDRSGSADPALQQLVHGIPATLQLELSGLDLVDVTDLAKALAGRRLPVSAARRFHSYTGGHPLLLRTMLNEISSQGLSSVDWRSAIPPSVASATRRRFSELPEPSRSLVEAMAVLGGRPLLAQVAEVAGIESAQQALGPALEAGLANWFPEEPACPVTIPHDLQREAVYSTLTPARRSQLHQRAATTVDHVLAWRHRVAAVSSKDELLASQLEQAAGEEAANGNHGTAATFLGWAADLTPWGPRGQKLLLTSMIHLLFSANRGQAKVFYPRAARCAHSRLRSLALGLCELYLTGERGKAEQHLLHAFGTGQPTTVHSWVRGAAAAGLVGISVWRGDTDQALAYSELALSTDGVPAPLRDYVVCLRGVARGRRDGLAAGLEEFGRLSDHPSDISPQDLEALSCRGSLRTLLGLVEEARGDLSEVVRRQEAGAPMLSGITPHCYLAAVQYQLGEWDDSATTMRRAALFSDDDQPAMNEVIRYFVASLVPSARGDWQTAEELVRSAATAAQRVGGPQDLKYAAIAAASLHQARNDYRGMLRALSAVPGLRTHGSSPGGPHEWWSTWWGPLLIDALQATGQPVEAARELATLRERAKGAHPATSTIIRLAAQQAVAEGNLQDAVDLARHGLAGLIEPRPRLAEGQLFHVHGLHLSILGDRAGAAQWLTAAVECFATLSAAPYRERAAADLARLLSATSTPPLAGLTSREQEITLLVRQHLTNREIAAALFVTPKTVEYHLSNIYAKLGITSRRDLGKLR
ncbi:helix-turn-helix transcriptional regulator [Kribbella sp. DT2]|uniref:helix-turn-helix transcriptional regulator n=1 Tax=Kribbella sp. DT2 TaxID=3393427 RepID=UPI003CF65CE2